MSGVNHVRPGRPAARQRRQNALDTLLKVKEPNKRQLAEIETLEKRIARRDYD